MAGLLFLSDSQSLFIEVLRHRGLPLIKGDGPQGIHQPRLICPVTELLENAQSLLIIATSITQMVLLAGQVAHGTQRPSLTTTNTLLTEDRDSFSGRLLRQVKFPFIGIDHTLIGK